MQDISPSVIDKATAASEAFDDIQLGVLDEREQTDEIETGNVYEKLPYFSFNMIRLTMLTYLVWTLVYFFYRAIWTINTFSIATRVFSYLFLLVEILSFIGMAIHMNNFANPCTNVLKKQLLDILKKKSQYPSIF